MVVLLGRDASMVKICILGEINECGCYCSISDARMTPYCCIYMLIFHSIFLILPAFEYGEREFGQWLSD
jgi:hypothetical protein